MALYKNSVTGDEHIQYLPILLFHACVIEDECLVGMNATILDGARIGRQSIVAAGTVVPQGMQVPDGSLVAGVPATVRKTLSPERRQGLRQWAEKYVEVAKAHRSCLSD